MTILLFMIFLGSFSTASQSSADIEFIGKDVLPTGTIFQKTEIGGLSGITYDAKNDVYYAISDDPGVRAPARFYTLKINLSQDRLRKGDISLVNVTPLLNEHGAIFPHYSTDTEGIAITNRNSIFISSEGNVNNLINPFISEFSLTTGKFMRTLPIPKKFLPSNNWHEGVRQNLSFESLTITPDQKKLFTATENALVQDGTAAKSGISSYCRILQYNLLTNQPEKEFLYQTQAIVPFLNISGKFASGLTDLLALDNRGNFLSLERSFNGWGFTIMLFHVSSKNADDIHGIDSLLAIDTQKIKQVEKKLLQKINLTLDNIEGITLGAKLSDGRPALILVSDNNFHRLQQTQVLAFKLNIHLPPVEDE